MKKLLLIFLSPLLSGCGGFGLGETPGPKYDIKLFGSYIKEVGNSYHLFSIGQQCDNPVYPEGTPYIDTLTIDDKLYRQVFFVQVIPKKLHKTAKNLDNLIPCVLREIMVKGDTARKQMPGYGERKFLVVENVVGFI